jgi:hypothetical protein
VADVKDTSVEAVDNGREGIAVGCDKPGRVIAVGYEVEDRDQ